MPQRNLGGNTKGALEWNGKNTGQVHQLCRR